MHDQPPSSDDSDGSDSSSSAGDPYRPARPTTPPRWRRLFNEVGVGLIGRRQDPSYPYAKIGPYDAEGVLGNGGHGFVYKVRDVELDRLVALKICSVESEAAAEAMMAEARILAKLSHPNIITIHGTGTHEGDRYFVMKFIDGMSLARYAFDEGEGPPPWEEFVEMFCTLGLALAAAHEAGVVHRDFKPANVMIERETMTPYIVDFGLAQVTSDPEREGGRGTLHYSAPEMLRGGLGDARSDQYSFCVSLWQCLDDGPTPFAGHDSEDFLVDIEAGEPPFDNLNVPEQVRDVLRKGMSFEPEDRYPNMRALVRELRLALGPRLVPGGGGEAPKSGTNSGLVALVVVLVAGLVIQHASWRARERAEGGVVRNEPVHDGQFESEPQVQPAEPTRNEVSLQSAATMTEDTTQAEDTVQMESTAQTDESLKTEAGALEGCAMSPWVPSAAAKGICSSIRQKNYVGADKLWKDSHHLANPQTADEWEMLIRDTLTIASTFESEGEVNKAAAWETFACHDLQLMMAEGLDAEAEALLSSAPALSECSP